MSVGDAFINGGVAQSVIDEMGGGGDATEAVGGTGTVITPGGGGDEGGVGVEAAAVVVITLLAVLGNAMVVATLVRRSMLQHPSNRLVLSLTGSNLILTVVVLPGMVTSLLMTSSSPVDQRSSVLTHTYNQSDRPSFENCNNSLGNSCDISVSLALSQQPQNDTLLMSHTSNGTSVELKNDLFIANMPLEGISSSIPLTNQATDAFVSSHSESSPRLLSSVPSHITTQSPNFGDVAATINSFPFSSREDDVSSTLSRQWEGFDSNQHDVESLQIHQPTVVSTNHNSVKHLNTEELIPTTVKGGLSVETHRQDALQISGHRGQVKAKDSLTVPDDIGDNQEEGIDIKKEIISRSIHDQNNMFPENRPSKISVEKDGELCACNDEVNQNNKNDENHHDSTDSQKNQEENPDNNKILNNEENLQQETIVRHDEIRPFDPTRENRHAARKRKQGTRHHHHLENRHRRSRDNSGYSHNVETRQSSNKQQVKNHEEGSIREDIGAIKQLIRQDQRALHKEDNIQEKSDAQVAEERTLLTKSIDLKDEGAQERIEQEVHLQIKQQQNQSGKHVILVRGVQEIEEQQEKQVLLLLVDREQPHVKEESLQLRLNENDGNFQSLDEKYSNLAKRPPDQDDHNNLNLSHDGPVYPEDFPPIQEQVMNSVELQIEEELQEGNKDGDSEEQQMEQMEQIYGGVEWESDRWEGGKILCQGAAFFTNLISAASALTVAVIAIDRYLAIVRPLVYGAMVTSGRCLLMLAWCWGQALLTALPPLLGWARYERREPYGRCGVAWGKSPSYTAVWTISVFLIPFGIMVVCYYHILQVARNKCRRIRVGKVSESSPPVTPITTSTCLEGFPFPLSVEHLTSPPMGSKAASPLATGPIVGKISPIVNLSSPQGKGPDPPLVRNISINGGLESYLDKPVPFRSHSISGILRVTDSTTNTNESSIKPKRKLADFGRSRSLCQVPQQPPRPCLRRVQSTFSVRHTLKKLSLGTRRPSWNSEGSPSKGFWTVFVVMGAHIVTWGPYTVMAVAEAILGREHLLLLPHWVMVTCTLLLFTASVFYPIVYGLYNRNIRKELLTCLCPTWSRRRGSHLRRPSTVPSYSGSVLDFTSLRQRCVSDKTEQCYNPSNGITETIATISSRVGSLACPSPLMILGGRDEALPTRGYNLNHRKPSQDSGTVMVGGEDQDSDTEAFAPTPRQYTTRRVSAPSVLSTVREDPHSTAVAIEDVHQISRHHSMNSKNVSYPLRKLPIVPLSVQLNATRPEVHTLLRRSFSLDKIHSSDKDIALDSKVTYRSLRKKRSNLLIRETQFNTPPASERTQRRRGSVAVVKVMSIPEDSGLPDYPEVTDSGRGSVDSGNISKTRVMSSRGSVDSTDFTKSYSLRCRGSVDSTDLTRIPILSRRGSVDSTELAMARAMSKRQSADSVDLSKISAARQVSIDEGIGGDCLPEETNSWE